MRIISGKYKGRRFNAPKNLPTRPTTDMAKEALFNILNNQYYFEDLNVLDLFAGIGSISFEFASRGAQQVISVDRHPKCIRFIDKIAKELELNIRTIRADVFKYLEKTKSTADIILADPPYALEKEKFQWIVDQVFEKNLLNENGILILEHAKETDLSDLINYGYSKKYGGSMFSFFENSAEN